MDGGDRSDLHALQLAREESRAVLDHQVALMNDIDDKAMRTVRTAVVILGILASAGGIAGTATLEAVSALVLLLLAIGVGCLFGATFAGIGTYAASDLEFGIGDVYRQDVRAYRYSQREYLTFLLDGYDEWISTMRTKTRRNATYLFWTQVLLVASFVALATAAGLLVLGNGA